MKVGTLSLSISILYMIIFIIPLRVKMWKRHGWQTYYDLKKLTNEGNSEAKRLLKRGKIMIGILVGGVSIELLTKLFY